MHPLRTRERRAVVYHAMLVCGAKLNRQAAIRIVVPQLVADSLAAAEVLEAGQVVVIFKVCCERLCVHGAIRTLVFETLRQWRTMRFGSWWERW